MHTETLARFVAETPSAEIPQAARAVARDALIDTVGVTLAGSVEPIAGIVGQWLDEFGGAPRATVLGSGRKVSCAEAAFANGIFAHAIDFDDSLPSLRGHPSATIVSALLAASEAPEGANGDILAAYVLGLEVAGKLGRAIGHGHYFRGWHTTATVGAFSATAAVARLWALDADQLRMAWGIAASQASGLVRNFGSMAKPFQVGHTARIGIVSAWLARRGFTADPDIFDGKHGFVDVYRGEDGAPLEERVAQAGRPWEALDPGVFVKQWPCCYCSHRAIGGLLALLEEHDIDPRAISAVRIGFPPGSDAALIKSDPQTGLEAKFSIEYAAAKILLDRELTLDSFSDETLRRPDIQALMKKVERVAIADKGTFSGLEGYNDIAVEAAGRTYEIRIDKVPGSPAWPPSDAARDEKFRQCARQALGRSGADALLAALKTCASAADVQAVLARAGGRKELV